MQTSIALPDAAATNTAPAASNYPNPQAVNAENAIRLIENKTERLRASELFTERLSMLLHDEAYTKLSAAKKFTALQRLFKEHQAALAPLDVAGQFLEGATLTF